MVPAEVLLGVGQMRDCRGGPVAEKIVRVLGLLPEALCGIHREAFSRAATAAAPLQARRYGDPAGVPGGGAGAADAAARGASQEAAEAASLVLAVAQTCVFADCLSVVPRRLRCSRSKKRWRYFPIRPIYFPIRPGKIPG